MTAAVTETDGRVEWTLKGDERFVISFRQGNRNRTIRVQLLRFGPHVGKDKAYVEGPIIRQATGEQSALWSGDLVKVDRLPQPVVVRILLHYMARGRYTYGEGWMW